MTTTLKEDLKEHLYTCIDKFTVHGFPVCFSVQSGI